MPDEIGYQTAPLMSWASLTLDSFEDNPELIWPKSINVFDKMRREDSQVGSVLRAVTFPIRSTTWSIDPAGARDEVTAQIAADLGLPLKGQEFEAPLRTAGRFSWGEHLRLALLCLVFGHSVFEQVYRIEDDGAAHLAKLAWRPPRTISSFDVAADGGLKAIKQHGTVGNADVTIPVDRVVVYVNEREGANWGGQSLLRTAYKNWLLKDRMLRAQALTIERNGLGIPTVIGAQAPEKATPEQQERWHKEQIEKGLALAKALRAGEQAGVAMAYGSVLKLLGVEGDLPDTDKPIRYHDEQIARAVLAHFLNLGTETGSWALGSTFANFFTGSLNAVANYIRDITQQHVIEDLVDANWGPNERAPRLVADTIGAEHPATAEAIKALVDAGIVHADDALESHMRETYALPARNTATQAVGPAEAAAIAAVVQKVYLGVGTVLTQEEARAIVRAAGAALGASAPTPTEPPKEPSRVEEQET